MSRGLGVGMSEVSSVGMSEVLGVILGVSNVPICN